MIPDFLPPETEIRVRAAAVYAYASYHRQFFLEALADLERTVELSSWAVNDLLDAVQRNDLTEAKRMMDSGIDSLVMLGQQHLRTFGDKNFDGKQLSGELQRVFGKMMQWPEKARN